MTKRNLYVFLVMLSLLTVSTYAFGYPTITHPVEDQAAALTNAEINSVASSIRAHAASTHVQIAVLIVPSTNGEPIEDFANGTALQWAGGQAGRDNGVLVVLAIHDHRSRIEVGTGLEERLTDSEATHILDDARPSLRASRFGDAVQSIVNGVIEQTGGAAGAGRPVPVSDNEDFLLFLVIIAVFIAGIAFIAWVLSSPRRRGSSASYSSRSSSIPYSVSSTSFSVSESSYTSPSSSSSSSSSDSSSSSSSSFFDSGGGGWGGGGGDFGGGGGSSDW